MKNSFSEVCSRMGFGILSSGRGGSPAHVSGGLQNGGGGGAAEDPRESLCSQPPADFGARFCQRWDRPGLAMAKGGSCACLSSYWAVSKVGPKETRLG